MSMPKESKTAFAKSASAPVLFLSLSLFLSRVHVCVLCEWCVVCVVCATGPSYLEMTVCVYIYRAQLPYGRTEGG
jgi:hypothetical protein